MDTFTTLAGLTTAGVISYLATVIVAVGLGLLGFAALVRLAIK